MRTLITLALFFGTITASAENSIVPPDGRNIGAETRSWTELQASGAAASADARPQPGEVATRAYERYLQSFTHPIPEKFDRDSFGSDSSGGGSGSTR